ncbi:MAG: FMN-binding protein [Candidatus Limnocylindrales bacterium]|jgi:uncharacterized protein with FMN-binding domain
MNLLPKRGVIGGALTAVALALILSFKTPEVTGLATGSTNGSTTGNTTGTQAQQTTGTGSATGRPSSFSGQLTGQAVRIPFGTVQVQVTLQNGKITDVQPLQLPNDQRRTQQISQYAAPQLRSEVLAAQSAQVDTISGATYTSEGYLQSLQSALDQAGA